MHRTVFVFLMILISPVSPVWSGSDANDNKAAKTYEIRRLAENESIKLDGQLNEPAWQSADIGSDFVQQVPREGEPATQRTEFRLLYDQKNIYIGIQCWQAAKIVVTDMHRDFAVMDNDIIEVIFDSFHDRTGGFDFATNPSGALFDVQWSGDGTEANTNWNAVWDVKTRVYESSWTAEFVIPFKTLRFTNSEKQEWGLNLRRAARYINEGSCWTSIPRRFKLGTVSLAGTMAGLENVQPGRNLKVKPYMLGSATRLPSRQNKPDFYLGKLGLDLKYGLTKGLTLDFTANTDFSQVEADVQQTNLTRFSLFFPEKREFFLENSNLFHMGEVLNNGSSDVMLFYSRRIGLDADGTPIPLLGGTRLSGHSGSYELGLLNMQSKELGTTPANNFTVARVRRHFGKNSDVGAIFINRQATGVDGNYNRVLGLDTNLRFTQNLIFNGFLAKSQTPRKSGNDWAGGVNLSYSKQSYRFWTRYREVDQNFNSEVGFVRRKDVRMLGGNFTWLFHPEDLLKIREIRPNLTVYNYLNATDNKLDTRTVNSGIDIEFHNGSLFQAWQEQTREILKNEFMPFPGRAIGQGDYGYGLFHLSYTHDNTKIISPNVQFEKGEYYNGHRTKWGGGFKFHPNAHISFETSIQRDQVEVSSGTYGVNLMLWRVNYSFNTRMFLDALIQYNSLTGQVNSNIRFNLIHHPLSDLFIVYNDNRDRRSGELVNRVLSIKFTQLFDF